TVSGTITTFGVATDFSVIITNILAPSPSDTAEVQQVIEETVAGLSNIQNLTVTIVNNTTDRITFDVSFEATQSGVTVTLDLRYDYVPAGSSPTDSGSDSGGDSASDGDSSLATDAEIAALENPDSPYQTGDTATFIFSSSGRLFID
ncbi:unnamed protein product, partial [Ectocarpus fasciculatus]